MGCEERGKGGGRVVFVLYHGNCLRLGGFLFDVGTFLSVLCTEFLKSFVVPWET